MCGQKVCHGTCGLAFQMPSSSQEGQSAAVLASGWGFTSVSCLPGNCFLCDWLNLRRRRNAGPGCGIDAAVMRKAGSDYFSPSCQPRLGVSLLL